jgi:hypothetical protein
VSRRGRKARCIGHRHLVVHVLEEAEHLRFLAFRGGERLRAGRAFPDVPHRNLARRSAELAVDQALNLFIVEVHQVFAS